MKGKKGAVSILLCVIFASVTLLVGAAGDACSLAVSKAYAQRINYLACKSVLAEYDVNLFRDYGLMGVEGGNQEIKESAEHYIAMMKRVNEGSQRETVFFDLEMEDMQISCSGKTLAEKEVLMSQIKEHMIYVGVTAGIEALSGLLNGVGGLDSQVEETKRSLAEATADADQGDGQSEPDGENGGEEAGGGTLENQRKPVSLGNNRKFDIDRGSSQRILRSERVISSLPSGEQNEDTERASYGLADEEELLELGEESSEFLNRFYSSASMGADKFILTEYIKRYFKNAVTCGTYEKATFFSNEAEYIIKGSFSDEKNYKAVKRRLFLLRTALNMTHIYSDTEKSQLTMEAAAALSGGVATAAVQFLLITAWAGAESGEDLKILYNGGKVPFIKQSGDWKLSLDSVLNGGDSVNEDYRGESGLDYSAYMQLFMFLKSRDELICRVMDLIQINMKGRYNVQFDLRNYTEGFSALTKFQRKAYLPGVLPGIIEDNAMTMEEVFEY